MEYKVEFTEGAEKDLFDIYYYIAMNDSFSIADKIISKIKEFCNTLSTYPLRGHRPNEVKNTSSEMLEIITSPYRIIYEIKDKTVQILFVIDGRRNIKQILEERLLD